MRPNIDADSAVDFSKSSSTWLLKEQPSYGRFALDAVLTIADHNDRGIEKFVLTTQVFAGNVYGDGWLFQEPPYEYSVAFSGTRFRMFRGPVRSERLDDTLGDISDRFREVRIDVDRVPCRRLTVDQLLIGRPATGQRLSARIFLPADGLEPAFELEFPLRHLNTNPEAKRFQAETGPVLMLENGSGDCLPRLRRGFVNFDRENRADFLLDAPEWSGSMQRWAARVRVGCEISILEVQHVAT
ncbi:MAG TPA: hypothetical protein VKS43_01755 [Burkholderiales bacterium]|nr:hypothetical protein [Burkholderiales bacterium]